MGSLPFIRELEAKIKARRDKIIKGKTPWSSGRCIDKLGELDWVRSELRKIRGEEG